MNVKKVMTAVLKYATIQLEVTTVIVIVDIICLMTIKLVLVNQIHN